MKNILSYISAFILILLSATSCEDNENWKIVTEAQPGTYIVGTATIFSGEATSSALKPIKLDGTDSKNDVIGIYTWLKAEGEFNISICTEAGTDPVHFGKGASVEEKADVISTNALDPSGPAFKVAKDGLYYVIVNSTLQQVSILPVSWYYRCCHRRIMEFGNSV